MLTLSAQAAISFALLLFAAIAVRISRILPRSSVAFRYGWALTAAAFMIQAVNSVLHDGFAIYAFWQGPESAAWNAILAWHPVLNHSRTFLLTTYCGVLSVSLLRARRGEPPLRFAKAILVLLAGMLVGGVVGWQEQAFSGLTHFTAVAIWDIMELLSIMVLLLVGLAGGMDRGLWSSLGVNAFVLALSVLWFAYLSRIDVGGQWSPRPYQIHLTKTALYVVMIAIAARHWRNLRLGKRARAFLDANPRRPVASLHG